MTGYYSGTIQKGSKGDDTKKWQEFLNTQGYSLSVDGSFDDLTDQATRDYQQKNGLTVDGIVGQNTWGKAGFKYVNTPVSAPTLGASPTAPTFDTTSWLDTDKGKDSDKIRQEANDAVKNYGDFSYSKDATFKDIMDKIINREKFSYDFNGDALYQQYKDKYIQQGKMAMQDTMGQAAAMTGGYGNSYAASVGNQAYQAQLNNLNDVIPELYQLAYDKYNQEGQDLYNQYSMLSDDKNMEYGMWGDKYNRLVDQRDYADSDFYNQADLYYNDQTNANNTAQQSWQNEYNTWAENTDNAQWEASWEEGQRRDQRDLDSGSGSDGSGGSEGSGNVTPSSNEISSSITKKAEGFENNSDLANYLDGLTASGAISEAQADQLYAEYMDGNEKSTLKEMANSTSGWSVVDDGGWNLWGVDNNARVKAPNGQVYRLDNLVDALVGEGMKKSDAKSLVKKLQKNLGI